MKSSPFFWTWSALPGNRWGGGGGSGEGLAGHGRCLVIRSHQLDSHSHIIRSWPHPGKSDLGGNKRYKRKTKFHFHCQLKKSVQQMAKIPLSNKSAQSHFLSWAASNLRFQKWIPIFSKSRRERRLPLTGMHFHRVFHKHLRIFHSGYFFQSKSCNWN